MQAQNLEEALKMVSESEVSNHADIGQLQEKPPNVVAYISNTPHVDSKENVEDLLNTPIGEVVITKSFCVRYWADK